MARRITQKELIFRYYEERPGKEVAHRDVVDWATEKYHELTGNVLRDPDRAIRKLYQDGKLQQISKGVYLYDQTLERERKLEDFSQRDKRLILERDNHRCVICGASRESGVELHVDHIKPKDKGGRATVENGQTLCSLHNIRKKNYGQTETGKKMFIRLLELAEKEDDAKLCAFIRDVLAMYEQHGINGHIVWNEPGDFAADER